MMGVRGVVWEPGVDATSELLPREIKRGQDLIREEEILGSPTVEAHPLNGSDILNLSEIEIAVSERKPDCVVVNRKQDLRHLLFELLQFGDSVYCTRIDLEAPPSGSDRLLPYPLVIVALNEQNGSLI